MRTSKVFSFVVLTLLAVASSACGIFGPKAQPTLDPIVFQATLNAASTQALETIAAQITQTAQAQPATQVPPTQEPTVIVITPTLESTATATSTSTQPPAPTATQVPATSTPTKTPSALDCTILSQSPASGAKFAVGYDFDGVWKLKNTGTQKWEMGNVDIKFDSGSKLQKYGDAYDLAKTVNPGEEITITIDMLAPQVAGTFKAVWKLMQGSTTICTMNLNIEVTNP
jgi:hypothetical protein